MRKARSRGAAGAAARQAQQHTEPGIDAPHSGALEVCAHSGQRLGQRRVDQVALDAEEDGLAGGVNKKDSRAEPLPCTEAALPIRRRQLLQNAFETSSAWC